MLSIVAGVQSYKSVVQVLERWCEEGLDRFYAGAGRIKFGLVPKSYNLHQSTATYALNPTPAHITAKPLVILNNPHRFKSYGVEQDALARIFLLRWP